MAAFVTQQMEPFDLSGDSNTWSFYVGRLRHLLLANEVERDAVRCSVLLASCGLPTYTLIQKELFPVPEAPADLASFDDIVDKVRHHLDRRPSTPALSFARVTLATSDVSNEAPAAPLPKDRCQEKYTSAMKTRSQSLTGEAATGLPLDLPPDSIMPLPEEMLIAIFKMLDVQDKCQVAQVCRRWRDTVEVGAVWRDTMIQVEITCLFMMIILPILKRRGVLKIKIPYELYSYKKVISMPYFFLNASPSLTHLHIYESLLLTADIVQKICQVFTKLVSLKLYCCDRAHRMSDMSINSICKGLKKLEFLTLGLDFNMGFTGAGLKQLTHSDLPLRFLTLSNWRLMPDDFFMNLSEGKPDLEGLELKDWPIMKNLWMESIAAMHNLHYLLVHCTNMNSNQLQLISNMVTLRKLELCFVNFDNETIQILAGGSSPINNLRLIHCREITGASLLTLSTMHHLRHLSLHGCGDVTEVGLEYLMKGNRNLISLDISNCSLLGSGALTRIMDSQPNQLQHLSMDRRHMDKESLALVSQRLRHLTVLYVPFKNLLAPKL